MGAVLANLGRYDEAIASLEKANRLVPDSPEVLYGLGLAYQEKGDAKRADDLFKKVIQDDKESKITELARTARREIALESLKSKGFRIDAVMYCLGALELFSSKARNEIFAIVSEIALLGRSGLDINNPEKKYRLNSLKGEFTGLHLLCYMYVGFRIIDENLLTICGWYLMMCWGILALAILLVAGTSWSGAGRKVTSLPQTAFTPLDNFLDWREEI